MPRAHLARAWVALAVASVGLFASLPARAAGTYHVDGANPACSDTGPGSAAQPYCTISAAVDAQGGPATTILVQPGTYREQVTLGASGSAGSRFVLQAVGAVTIDGSDDFSSTSLWALESGDVYLAASVTWDPKQVFLDGVRLAPSTLSPSSIPAGSFRYVIGTGLYVNAGGGNPGTHDVAVSRRPHGVRASEKAFLTVDGFTIQRTSDRGIYMSTNSHFAEILDNIVRETYRPGIQISNSTDGLISGNISADALDHGIALMNNTNTTVENNETYGHAKPVPTSVASGLYLSGSSDNFLRNNRIHGCTGSGLYIQTGSDNRSIQNVSWGNGRRGYDLWNTLDTRHIGDVAWGNTRSGFAVRGTSTGARIHNCIGVDNGLAPQNEWNLEVATTAAAGFVSDDNIWWNSAAQDLIDYSGTEYPTVAAFTSATGHGTRSLEADPKFVDAAAADFHLMSGSPAIDAANSSVADWPALDAEGLPRNDDAGTPNTGIGPVDYADRGAHERQGVPSVPPTASLIVSPSSGTAPLTVTADASGSTPGDTAIVSYTFDFGDGTIVGPQPAATAPHTYAVGQWQAMVIVTDAIGDTASAVQAVSVTGGGNAPNGFIDTPVKDLVVGAGQAVFFTGHGEDFDNDPMTYAWDLGGGAANSTLEDPEIVFFDSAGTYLVTLTVTDTSGNVDPTPATRTITVTAAPELLTADEIHWTILSETAVTFDWRGPANSIQYGLTASYGQSVNAATPSPLPWSSPGPFWEAKLTGLLPNTVYHYSIGGSPDQTFKTPRVRGTSDFTAVTMGDVGSTLRYYRVGHVAAQIAAIAPDLLIHSGDISYGNDHGQEAVDQAFNNAMLWTRETAFMPAWGNHDWEPDDDLDNYKGRFDLPNPQTSPGASTPGGEDWFWFDYGNVRFISYPEPWPGAWADWELEADTLMTQAQSDPDIDFVVTWGHRAAYSSGHHSGARALREILDTLGTRYPKYVLNMNSHSHNYERTHPQGGVIHITAGTGGATLEAADGSCMWRGGCPPPAYTAFRAMHHGFMKLTFTATGILGEAICGPPGDDNNNPNDITCDMGSVFDSFTIGNPDRTPVVTAPPNAPAFEDSMVTVHITVDDPDGETITTLSADLSSLPAGHNAIFVPAFDNKSGTLTWTPTFDDAASYDVTFSASNGLTGEATTTIDVANVDRAPFASAAATASGLENASLEVNVTAGDLDGDAIASLTADFSDLPLDHGATFTPGPGNTSGTLTWTPTYDHAGSYAVPFIAANALRGSTTTVVTVTNVDRAPGVVAPSIAAAAEGETLTIVIGASDSDGDTITTLTADLSALPAGHGATFAPGANNTTGTFTWMPSFDHAGDYTVTFTASNALSGNDATSLMVTNVDRPPTLATNDVVGAENGQITVEVSASDPDGDPITSLTADLAGLPAGHDAVFVPGGGNAAGTLTWTPTYDDSGSYTVNFTASNALSADTAATITVSNTDRGPLVMAPSDVSGAEDVLLTVVVSASDADADPITSLTADLSGLPPGHGATFTPNGDNTSGTLSWTPRFGDTGLHTVSFTASNALSGHDSTSITISNTDRGPVVSAPATVQVDENELLTVIVSASDPDGDPITTLSADLSALPAGHGASFVAGPGNLSGTLSWTPGFEDGGGVPFAVTFTATNALSGGAMTSITVDHVDRAPIVTAPSNVAAQRGELVTVNVSAADPDGEAIASLSADLSSLPVGHDAVFTPGPGQTTGVLTWTPGAPDTGDFSVSFSATNALQGTSQSTLMVDVGDRPPVIVAPPSVQAAENQPMTLMVTASDPDGDAIDSLKADYSKFPIGNASFVADPTNTTGTFTWTPQPGNGASGFYFVFFMAHNAQLAEAGTVIFVDQAPVLTAADTVHAMGTVALTLPIGIADPDGDRIDSVTADLSGLPAGHHAVFTVAPDSLSGQLVWTPSMSDTGETYLVTFRATNATWGEKTVAISVTFDNETPIAAAATTPSVGIDPFPFTVDASASTDAEGPIVSYWFDFGDGTVIGPQAGPIANHVYEAGEWTLIITVSDTFGATDTLAVPVHVTANMCGNPSFEDNSAGGNSYRGSFLQRISGGYVGDHMLEITGPDNLNEYGTNDSPDWISGTAVVGDRYRYTAMVRSLTDSGTARIRIREYVSGVQQGVTTYSHELPLTPEWQVLAVEYRPVAFGSSLNMQILNNPQVPGEVFQVDYVTIAHHADEVTDVGDRTLSAGVRASVHPNPARSRLNLRFAMPQAGEVTVHIYDLSGRRVHTPIQGVFDAGAHDVPLGVRGRIGHRLPSGVYFYRLRAPGGSASGRFVLLD